MPLDELRSKRFWAFAGIANPSALEKQLRQMAGECVGCTWLADHHDYTDEDLVQIRQRAAEAGADVLIATEKDWIKIRRLESAAEGMAIWRLEMEIQFEGSGEGGLLELIRARIDSRREREREKR